MTAIHIVVSHLKVDLNYPNNSYFQHFLSSSTDKDQLFLKNPSQIIDGNLFTYPLEIYFTCLGISKTVSGAKNLD